MSLEAMGPMHLLLILIDFVQTLGFESYVEEVEGVLKDHKQAQKVR